MRTLLLLAALQWPMGAPAPVAPPAAELADGGVAAIPVPQILRSAEDAHRTVKSMDARLENRQLVEGIRASLPAVVAKIDPLASQEALLSRRDMADLRPALLRADQTLATWEAALEAAVRSLFTSRQELQRMDAAWAATENASALEQVPQ